MPKFRKKPVVIEAIRWLGEPATKLSAVNDFMGTDAINFEGDISCARVVLIPTLEGEMRCQPGDWLIKGVNGEFYPCKPDIFEKTYDPAD